MGDGLSRREGEWPCARHEAEKKGGVIYIQDQRETKEFFELFPRIGSVLRGGGGGGGGFGLLCRGKRGRGGH